MNALVALRLGRVSNLPTVWTNVLSGLVLAGGHWSNQTFALLVSMSMFYVGGMYLNDAFDREIDARERPERPIPSGLVSPRTVFACGFAMLACGLALLIWLGYGTPGGSGWRPAAAGLGLAAAIVAYDMFHKDNPLSPVLMGLCRVLIYVGAGLTVARTLPSELWLGAAMLLCYLIGLTYAAKQEALGRVGSLWPLAFLAAPFLVYLPWQNPEPFIVLVYAGFLAWALYAVSLLIRAGRGDVPRAVVSLIAGIALLDALILVANGAAVLGAVALAGFFVTLLLQRFVPGT